MKKNIACPNCKGKGYNTVVTGDRNDYCGVANKMCPECNGTGLKLADMTNADRIWAMTDEELAELFSGMCKNSEMCGTCPMDGNCPGGSTDFNSWLQWLQQPAGE